MKFSKLVLFLMLLFNGFVNAETIYIYNSQSASNRIQFGVETLSKD